MSARTLCMICGLTMLGAIEAKATEVTLVNSEMIYNEAPFPSCHASTLVETPSGLVASWFGGQREGDPSVGIWLSRHEDGSWTPPVEVANGNQLSGPVLRYPCWNPVLHQFKGGPLALFYKVGPNPREWWGMVIESTDDGKSWSAPRRLPDRILGPIKNKPLALGNGTLLCGSSSEHEGWRVHFEWTTDQGKTWQRTDAINDGKEFGIIQPALFRLADDTIVAYCRSRQRVIVETRSTDGGQSWSPAVATTLPNPNSGFDGVSLADGGHALIYNRIPAGRTPLNLAMAPDDSLDWKEVLVLEDQPGEYSYPAIIQTADGHLHMTYTWKRQRIKHVEVKLED